jgi:MFS superfamily sulfate permease-like transporter
MNGTLAMALASFITAFVLGCLISSVMFTARISHSQRRMERRVRHWRGIALSMGYMAQPSRQLADSPAWDDLVDWPPGSAEKPQA